MTVCELCGREVLIGQFPFCPHGVPIWNAQPFKAVTDDNLGEYKKDKHGRSVWVPAHITSQADRRRLMKEQHKDYHGRRVGEPGCEV